MDDEVKKLIGEQYAKLPAALQEALNSSSLHEQIVAIGTKNQLHIDQMGLLEDEVVMLMMGFTDPIDFAGALHENVHVDAALAQTIATEVNQEILLPIRDKLESETVEPEAQVIEEPAKSVVMPSKVAATNTIPADIASTDMQITAPAPAAVGEIQAPVSAVSAPSTSSDTSVSFIQEDKMLTEPTVSLPPTTAAPLAKAPTPAPPPTYKTDPYHEPIE